MEATQELQNAQTLLEQESNVIDRGAIGSVINETDVPFSIKWPDGTTTVVAAQTEVASNVLFSTYKNGSLTGGIISFVPQPSGVDITESDAQSQSDGLSYSLLFNVQGLNEPGYDYGALNKVAITRSYPVGSTRAQSLDLDNLVDEDEIWKVDITLNYVSTLGDGSTFIYPRFSKLYLNQYDENDNSTSS